MAAAAYRAGVDLVNERDGMRHNYSRRKGIEGAVIMAPDGAPEWVKGRATLWNQVEAIEKRKDAQLAREVTLALPAELSSNQRQKLVRDFVQKHFVDHGMVADVAFHAPGQEGDQRNHHAHVMLTMRELGPEGFGKKNRDWNRKEVLTGWRKGWEEAANDALEQAQRAERIDCRSLNEQEVDRLPEFHQGPHATAMERKAQAKAEREKIPYQPVTNVGLQNQNVRAQNQFLMKVQRAIEQAQKTIESIEQRAQEVARASVKWWENLRKNIGYTLAEKPASTHELEQKTINFQNCSEEIDEEGRYLPSSRGERYPSTRPGRDRQGFEPY